MRPISEIIFHCTATRADWWADKTTAQKVAEVRRWHVEERGWSDIGYHFLIDRDGTVAEGRPIERTGAHVKGHNTGTIGISLFGGGNFVVQRGAFDLNFTEKQGTALRRLVARLQAEHGPNLKLSGHHEYANKACPCFDVRSWFALTVPAPRTSPAQSTTMQASAAGAISVITGAGTAMSQLDGTAQIVVIACAFVAIAGLAWVMRERLKRWARGDR
jgi:N-acetylmuramoyl-L-alanine amidase